MTANHTHTPLELQLHRLRTHYAANRLEEEAMPFDRSFNMFDHVIAQVEAAAEQRGAERVLKYMQDHVNEVSQHSYIGNALQDLIAQADAHRADLLEGDDE